MKEIVILSGKGGTGKTSITASFACLANAPVLADCDVDAADLHLVLEPAVRETHDFSGGATARFDKAKCTGCGRCIELCRFGAITTAQNSYIIDTSACEGCGVCADLCPSSAISMEETVNGRWFKSDTRAGPMVHARLGASAENSGKLVTLIRRETEEIAEALGRNLILVDGPPGIGCPVIASLIGTDTAVLVTEPTVSGAHDLERIYSLTSHFKIPVCILINKADINLEQTARIRAYTEEHGLTYLGDIPYDPVITEAQLAKKSVVEFRDGPVNNAIKNAWGRLLQAIEE